MVGCFTQYEGYAPTPTQCSPVGADDPTSQEYLSCGQGNTCEFTDGPGTFDPSHTSCIEALSTASKPGDACTYSNDCSQGLACAGTQCVALCFMGNSCADGQACEANDPPLSVNGRAVGACP